MVTHRMWLGQAGMTSRRVRGLQQQHSGWGRSHPIKGRLESSLKFRGGGGISELSRGLGRRFGSGRDRDT